MTFRKRWPLAFMLLVVLQACNCEGCLGEGPLGEIPPQTTQVDEFCQRAASKVDVLWVIDNSGSMASEQNKVADRFFEFFRQLRTSLVDYHIGVVTTTIQDGIQENANGILRRYPGSPVQGCDGCRWLTRDVPCDDADITRNEGESLGDFEARLRQDCPAAYVFRKMVTIDESGSSFEQGLAASALALGAVIDPDTGEYDRFNGEPIIPDVNKGFIRKREGTCQPVPNTQAGLNCAEQQPDNCAEPSLYIIYISDEQDFSDGATRYYYRILEGLKGAGNEGKISTSVITGWPTGASIPVGEVCNILRNSYDNDPNNDTQLGQLQDILRREDFVCTDPTDMQLGTRDSRLGSRYIDVACRTGGVIADICSQEYSTALDALGADAAGLARKYVLGNWDKADWGPDGIADTSDDLWEISNCDGDKSTRGPNDFSICVRATALGTDNEVLVPKDHGTGWHLEASTKSIRFDGSFIPKPGSKVTVTYPLKQEEQAQ